MPGPVGRSVQKLMLGEDHNHGYQILERVRDLVHMPLDHQIEGTRFHTVFLADPAVDPSLLEPDHPDAIGLLEAMAGEGDGEFFIIHAGDEVPYADLVLQQP